jgi:tetratricopeptide (TPR) repeat protein
MASLDRTKDALECYRQASLLNERILKIDPSNVRARRAEAIDDYKIANVVMDTDTNAAIAGFQKALSELSLLPKEVQSGAPIVRLEVIIEGHLGGAYFRQGKLAEAIAKKRHVREQTAILVARDPLDNRARYDMVTTDNSLGEILTAAGDRQGARQAYQEALQNIAFMLKRDPDNAVFKDHRKDLAEALAELDRPPGAHKHSPR